MLDFEFVSRSNNTNTQGNVYSKFLTILLSVKSLKLSKFCLIGHCKNCFVLMLLFDIGKVCQKNIHPKNKYFFAYYIVYISRFVTWGHTTRVIFTVKICIFERSNEKNNFSKIKINFYKKTTTQLLGHIGLQNIKVGVKSNFEWISAVCLIHQC